MAEIPPMGTTADALEQSFREQIDDVLGNERAAHLDKMPVRLYKNDTEMMRRKGITLPTFNGRAMRSSTLTHVRRRTRRRFSRRSLPCRRTQNEIFAIAIGHC